jgi:hypothetical protein
VEIQINDIPAVGELVSRIVCEAEELVIGQLCAMIAPAPSAVVK